MRESTPLPLFRCHSWKEARRKGQQQSLQLLRVRVVSDGDTQEGIRSLGEQQVFYRAEEASHYIPPPSTSMSFIAWNCRDLSNLETVSYLFALVQNCNPTICFFQKLRANYGS